MKLKLLLGGVCLMLVSCGPQRHYHPPPHHPGPYANYDNHRGHPKNQIINECGSNYHIAPETVGNSGTINVFCGDRTPQNPVHWPRWSYGNQFQWNGYWYYFWY